MTKGNDLRRTFSRSIPIIYFQISFAQEMQKPLNLIADNTFRWPYSLFLSHKKTLEAFHSNLQFCFSLISTRIDAMNSL